jgi:hypothetical protein
MTLFVLLVSVLVIAGLLWFLKDLWVSGGNGLFRDSKDSKESFETQTGLLGLGYSQLSSQQQQQANATEPITVPVVEQTYQRDTAAAAQTMQSIQQGTMAEINAFQMVPLQPADQAFAAAQAPALSPANAAAAARREADVVSSEYQALVERRDRNLLEACYQDSCASTESQMNEECRTFNEECHIRNADNIHLCLGSLNGKCNRSLLDKCRDACMTFLGRRVERVKLIQADVLNMNERLVSPSGSTSLHLSDEGSLELWVNGLLSWKIDPLSSASATMMGPYKLLIQSNGDMVIKNGVNSDIWHTNTWLDAFKAGSVNSPYELVVQEGEVALKNKNGEDIWKK